MLLPHEVPVPLPIDDEERGGVLGEVDGGGVDLDVRSLALLGNPGEPLPYRKPRASWGRRPGEVSLDSLLGEVPAEGRCFPVGVVLAHGARESKGDDVDHEPFRSYDVSSVSLERILLSAPDPTLIPLFPLLFLWASSKTMCTEGTVSSTKGKT